MFARSMFRASRLSCRYFATGTSTTPPLLLKIRQDLKTAMRNKDTNRLNVLRSILSQTLNASKTASPINTDMQMLALLKKTANAGKAASEEFAGQGRQDLADKENSQVSILEQYAGTVEVLGETEVREVVKSLVDAIKGEGGSLRMGDVLKRVFDAAVLGEKNVDKGEVTTIVKDVLAET